MNMLIIAVIYLCKMNSACVPIEAKEWIVDQKDPFAQEKLCKDWLRNKQWDNYAYKLKPGQYLKGQCTLTLRKDK